MLKRPLSDLKKKLLPTFKNKDVGPYSNYDGVNGIALSNCKIWIKYIK